MGVLKSQSLVKVFSTERGTRRRRRRKRSRRRKKKKRRRITKFLWDRFARKL